VIDRFKAPGGPQSVGLVRFDWSYRLGVPNYAGIWHVLQDLVLHAI